MAGDTALILTKSPLFCNFISEVPSWKLIESTWTVVLGYFTATNLSSEHFNYNEAKSNFMDGNNMEGLIRELVPNYTFPAGTILDIAGLQGESFVNY